MRAGMLAVAIGTAAWLAVERAPAPANAWDRDVHEFVTFAVALADSWSWDEASTIAYATQGVDENSTTQPVQAGPRPSFPFIGITDVVYRLHCFSRTADKIGLPNQDVRDNLERLKARASAAAERAAAEKAAGAPTAAASATEALIREGVYLHCLQDSYSHSGYGGKAFGHGPNNVWPPGSHGKNSPDNPAKYPPNAANATVRTLEELSNLMMLLHGHSTDIDAEDLDLLLKAITNLIAYETESMTDPGSPVRQECNRALIAHWLWKQLKADGKLHDPNKRPPGTSDRGPEFDETPPILYVIPGEDAEDRDACRAIFSGTFGESTAQAGYIGGWYMPPLHPPKSPYPRLTVDGDPVTGDIAPSGKYTPLGDLARVNVSLNNVRAATMQVGQGCRVVVQGELANASPEAQEGLGVIVGLEDAATAEEPPGTSGWPATNPGYTAHEVGTLAAGSSMDVLVSLSVAGPCPAAVFVTALMGRIVPGGAFMALDTDLHGSDDAAAIVTGAPLTRRAVLAGVVAGTAVTAPLLVSGTYAGMVTVLPPVEENDPAGHRCCVMPGSSWDVLQTRDTETGEVRIRLDGVLPGITLETEIAGTGAPFTATSLGTIAGYVGVSVAFSGTVTPEEGIDGVLVVGSNGALPMGESITFAVDLRKQ